MNEYEILMEIAASRRSVRNFKSDPVPEEFIDKIIQAAKTTPYASGKKHWGIKVIDDKKIILRAADITNNRISCTMKSMKDNFKDGFSSYSRYFTSFSSAPVLLVPFFRIAPSISLMLTETTPEIELWERDNWIKSISCVTMLILLAAETLGLGSCYITGALLAEEELKELFNINKSRNIGAIVPIGFKEN